MAQKIFHLLELRKGGASYYLAAQNGGFAFTKEWTQAERYRDKRYAEKRLIDLRAMYPGFELWNEIKVEEHGTV